MRSKTFRESYREDIRIFQTIWVKFWLTLFAIGLLSLPFWADPYIVYMVNISGIAIIAALGLNILTGLTGQISLGHAAFVALGAYTSAILATRLDMPFWLTIPAGGLVAALFGVLLGFPLSPSQRAVSGDGHHVVRGSCGIWSNPLGVSDHGRSRNLRPSSNLFRLYSWRPVQTFLCHSFFCDVLTLGAKNLARTRVGRAFVAIRDRDVAAEVIGVNLTKYKVMAFAISSFYGGVAGGLYSYSTTLSASGKFYTSTLHRIHCHDHRRRSRVDFGLHIRSRVSYSDAGHHKGHCGFPGTSIRVSSGSI